MSADSAQMFACHSPAGLRRVVTFDLDSTLTLCITLKCCAVGADVFFPRTSLNKLHYALLPGILCGSKERRLFIFCSVSLISGRGAGARRGLFLKSSFAAPFKIRNGRICSVKLPSPSGAFGFRR